MIRVKLKENIIVISKFINWEKIFANIKNKKELFERELMTWNINGSKSHVSHKQTWSIANSDLVCPNIFLKIQIQITNIVGEVMSRTSVWIPFFISG